MEKGEESMQRGDIVCLKSGGPAMTVLIVDEKVTECQWFNLMGEVCREPFCNDTLKPSSPTNLYHSITALFDRIRVDIYNRG
jgi:uncharacterized protein YodC (DUF2158 family)